MNPWAFLVIMVGILLIIIGVKGSQHNIVAAITGHTPQASTANTTAATNPPPAGTILVSSTSNQPPPSTSSGNAG